MERMAFQLALLAIAGLLARAGTAAARIAALTATTARNILLAGTHFIANLVLGGLTAMGNLLAALGNALRAWFTRTPQAPSNNLVVLAATNANHERKRATLALIMLFLSFVAQMFVLAAEAWIFGTLSKVVILTGFAWLVATIVLMMARAGWAFTWPAIAAAFWPKGDAQDEANLPDKLQEMGKVLILLPTVVNGMIAEMFYFLPGTTLRLAFVVIATSVLTWVAGRLITSDLKIEAIKVIERFHIRRLIPAEIVILLMIVFWGWFHGPSDIKATAPGKVKVAQGVVEAINDVKYVGRTVAIGSGMLDTTARKAATPSALDRAFKAKPAQVQAAAANAPSSNAQQVLRSTEAVLHAGTGEVATDLVVGPGEALVVNAEACGQYRWVSDFDIQGTGVSAMTGPEGKGYTPERIASDSVRKLYVAPNINVGAVGVRIGENPAHGYMRGGRTIQFEGGAVSAFLNTMRNYPEADGVCLVKLQVIKN